MYPFVFRTPINQSDNDLITLIGNQKKNFISNRAFYEVIMTKEEAVKPDPTFPAKVIAEGGKTLMLCFQCGTCTGSCPSGRVTAFRVRKLLRRAQLGLTNEVLPSDDLWLCSTCYTCYERCPRGVEITDIIILLRNLAVREGHMAEAHKRTAGFLIKTGHMLPFDDKVKAMRKNVSLPETPATTLADANALKEVQDIIKKTGFDKLVGGGK
jgi:heterodisulfide reductase subunit C